jgi:cytochrome c peroxidase
MKPIRYFFGAATTLFGVAMFASLSAQGNSVGNRQDGKRIFERETFGGNGRTCATCHTSETGTISPADALRRFTANPKDPLFMHDGSDDGQGHGVSRMLKDATILVEIPLPTNVSLADDPNARSVVLRRGIATTLNTPALDPVLMLDGPTVVTPDPGRALVTGIGPADDPTFENVNAFKISPLRGIRNTAPYFHDNSAKTLEDVVRHYALFFAFVSNNVIVLSEQDQADIVAFLKLL